MKALQTELPREYPARDEEIARMVERAVPRIRAIISRYARMEWALSADDADDVAATVRLLLVRRLRAAEGAPEEIRDFDGYVATTTYNTLYDALRRRFPERARLKNRLRYLLTHDSRFALWTTEAGTFCGLREWEGLEVVAASIGIDRNNATRAMFDRSRPAEALADVFRAAGRPALLNAIVDLAASLWDISDRPPGRVETKSSEDASPGVRFEWRQYLQAVWARVRDLRPEHGAALLLNLRDGSGENGLLVLVASGIATMEQIARAAGLSQERLAELWDDLPLEDSSIANILGISRQQVINYRQAARRKLSNQFPDRNL